MSLFDQNHQIFIVLILNLNFSNFHSQLSIDLSIHLIIISTITFLGSIITLIIASINHNLIDCYLILINL